MCIRDSIKRASSWCRCDGEHIARSNACPCDRRLASGVDLVVCFPVRIRSGRAGGRSTHFHSHGLRVFRMQLLMIGVDTETTSEQCYSHADCANDAFCGVVPCFGLKCARCLRCSACTCNKASVDGVCPAQRCALYAQVPVLSARRLSGVYLSLIHI